MIKETKALFSGTFTPCKKIDDLVDREDIIGQIFQAFDRDVEARFNGKIIWLAESGTIVKKGKAVCKIEDGSEEELIS